MIAVAMFLIISFVLIVLATSELAKSASLRSVRLNLERLEERTVPAVLFWNGDDNGDL